MVTTKSSECAITHPARRSRTDRQHDQWPAGLRMSSSEQNVRLDSGASRHDAVAEPWDADSAEALMQIYEHVVPAAALASRPLPFSEPNPIPSFLAIAQTSRNDEPQSHRTDATLPPPAVPVVHAHPNDKAWLDTRLSEISERFEKSVAAANPEASLNILSTRLDQLEKQFETALDKVATRTDVDSLRLVEAHVTELASQFTETQKQLARLEAIEEHLHDLTAYAAASSGDQISVQQQAGPAAIVELPDWDVISDSTADRVLSRLAGMPPKPSAEADSIDQINNTLLSFVDEYRREIPEHFRCPRYDAGGPRSAHRPRRRPPPYGRPADRNSPRTVDPAAGSNPAAR